jgi:hypothetical protein
VTVLPAFIAYGDSNMANSYEFSWYERALAHRYPYFRMNSAGAALGRTANANVIAQVEGHKYVIFAMGTNNFGTAAATNIASIQADIGRFRTAGIEKVLICTLPPTTTSSDSYATATNQTPTPGTTPNRENLNDLIRAMASSPGGSNADAVFDAASYVEVNSSNLFTINGKAWAIKTAPGSGTAATYGTGPHYEERGMAAAAVGGALAIDRLVDAETGFLQQNPDLGT